MIKRFCFAAVFLSASCTGWTPCLNSQEIKSETIVTGLNNPCAVAVQPESDIVFISDSGAGRVIRIIGGMTATPTPEPPLDQYGEDPSFKIGPLGLAFIDPSTLVVGGGGLPNEKEIVRVYNVTTDIDAPPLQADEMITELSLPETDQAQAEGNFYGLTVARELGRRFGVRLHLVGSSP